MCDVCIYVMNRDSMRPVFAFITLPGLRFELVDTRLSISVFGGGKSDACRSKSATAHLFLGLLDFKSVNVVTEGWWTMRYVCIQICSKTGCRYTFT